LERLLRSGDAALGPPNALTHERFIPRPRAHHRGNRTSIKEVTMIRVRRSVRAGLTVAAIAVGAHLHPDPSVPSAGPSRAEAMYESIEGFGALTAGGAGKPDCVVTSLADSGAGTLRQCLSSGNRYVRFKIAGTITLASQLGILGPYVTIDGSTAPSPGITLRGFGINIWDQHDVIVSGLRIRDVAGGFSGKSSSDCIAIFGPGTFNVVIDHVSIHNCADGGIDISGGPKNITIQWSIVSTPKAMLWGSTSSSLNNDTDRISMHHTAVICGVWPPINGTEVGCDRFPLIRAGGRVVRADLRRNVFSGWLRANGTKIEPAAWVNVVGNAYIPRPDSSGSQRNESIAVNPGTRVYTAGNIELGASPRPNLNDNGNEASPMPAPPITERELGCVVRDAGMHPRDAVDQKLLKDLAPVPADCDDAPVPPAPPASPPPPAPAPVADLVPRALVAPSTGEAGHSSSVSATVANAGTGSAAGSTVRLYLSVDRAVDTGDVSLGSIAVPSLAPGATHTGTTTVTVPAGTSAGAYMLLARADDGRAITESSETNNILAIPFTVTTSSATFTPVLVEAESMALASGMSVGSDPGALGGRYISATSGGNTTRPVREASAAVTIPAAGTYYLWARMYAPSYAADALYFGIDASWDRTVAAVVGAYRWVRIETANGSGAFGFRLTAGTHVIQAARGEVHARLDAVYLTDVASDVPAFSPGAGAIPLLVEAESMTRTGLSVGSDPGALGGQYLSATSGANSTAPVREASVPVTIATAGTYYLWARLYGPSPTSDALYVGIDGSWDRVYPTVTREYQWVRIETSNGSGAAGFKLAPGTHVIQVGRGETQARVDAVYLTNSASDVPRFAR
jgi:hypothetical protein